MFSRQSSSLNSTCQLWQKVSDVYVVSLLVPRPYPAFSIAGDRPGSDMYMYSIIEIRVVCCSVPYTSTVCGGTIGRMYLLLTYTHNV